MLLIAPIWANQTWFPLLLENPIDLPIILPETPGPYGGVQPICNPKLSETYVGSNQNRGSFQDNLLFMEMWHQEIPFIRLIK